MLNNKVPHPPVRMNIFGRMRYSRDTNAGDYEDFCFDDVWRAIGTLWAVVGLLVVNAVREKYKSR
ncbi:hypothetical protein DW954_09510 [Clostridium sp. AM45-5]|nr:hypothetical protein [Clostridium sp. AM45-5]RHS65913.1 hypothetical protein DW954_09510 [Clostridium sp. AM45-5]